MNERELKDKLDYIKRHMRLMDSIIYEDYKTHEGKLSENQVEIAKELFKLFKDLNWQIALNSYKQLEYKKEDTINTRECGTPVKVRSCKKEHGDKTYFGILIGDVALSIQHSIDKEGNLTASHSMYNPAIFVPELNDIVYGCGSWWGRIKNEEELEEMISDELIKNVWYVKALKVLTNEPETHTS